MSTTVQTTLVHQFPLQQREKISEILNKMWCVEMIFFLFAAHPCQVLSN